MIGATLAAFMVGKQWKSIQYSAVLNVQKIPLLLQTNLISPAELALSIELTLEQVPLNIQLTKDYLYYVLK